jgi:hypothetical protein
VPQRLGPNLVVGVHARDPAVGVRVQLLERAPPQRLVRAAAVEMRLPSGSITQSAELR